MSTRHNHPPSIPLISGTYFALLSMIATLLFYAVKDQHQIIKFISTVESMYIAAIVTFVFAALFGRWIAQPTRHYLLASFAKGFLMAVCIVPFYSLGIMLLVPLHHPDILSSSSSVYQHFNVWLFLTSFHYLYGGLIMAAFSGLAAMYFKVYLLTYLTDEPNRYCPKTKKKFATTKLKHI